MKITVVGAGAVGGYFGGRLQEAGLDVTFLVREKRAEQLKKTGLVIESPFGNAHLTPKLALHGEEIDECDLVLLAVKNYHLKDGIPSLRPLVENGAKVLPLMNGIEHYEILKEEFGEETVLGGLCQIIATLDSEGKIIHSNQLHLAIFGPLVPNQGKFCHQFDKVVSAVNSKWRLSEKIFVDIWNKYVFISAFSGITTASRLPIDEVMACNATADVFRRALAEMITLSSAMGAPQAQGLVETIIEQIGKQPNGSTSSMHEDLRKGLQLEVESLQGAAVRLAKQVGVLVPVLNTLYGLIKPYEMPRGK